MSEEERVELTVHKYYYILQKDSNDYNTFTWIG